jgi:hypothetical protein
MIADRGDTVATDFEKVDGGGLRLFVTRSNESQVAEEKLFLETFYECG